jgi:RNA polymerase-binding transcription factor DksA
MTKTDLTSYRRTLLALRSRLTGNISHLAEEALRANGSETSGNLSHTPIHIADLGSDSFEQEFTLSLLQNEEQVLEEIAEALDRIDKGTFGRCEECGGPVVPRERLKELPYTRYCVTCAKKRDRKRT